MRDKAIEDTARIYNNDDDDAVEEVQGSALI